MSTIFTISRNSNLNSPQCSSKEEWDLEGPSVQFLSKRCALSVSTELLTLCPLSELNSSSVDLSMWHRAQANISCPWVGSVSRLLRQYSFQPGWSVGRMSSCLLRDLTERAFICLQKTMQKFLEWPLFNLLCLWLKSLKFATKCPANQRQGPPLLLSLTALLASVSRAWFWEHFLHWFTIFSG